MSHGSIGAYGSNNLSHTLTKLLARLEDLPTPPSGDADKGEGKAERQGGDKKHPPRGEARLSSQILNVLLRLQQQQEATAAETDSTTTDSAAAGAAEGTADATAEGTADGTATETSNEPRKSPVHRLFAAIDANSDGSIDKDELTKFITEKGGSAEEAERLFAVLDKDSDGAVSEEQLAASIRRGHHGHHHGGLGLTELAEKLFRRIDGDDDGNLSKDELTAYLAKRGGSEEEAEAKYAKLDPDGDGQVDQAAFLDALRANGPGRRAWGHRFDRRGGIEA